MGLFSGFKGLVEPLVGAGVGFLAGGPIGAAVGAGIGFNIAGASAQADALEKSGRVAEANALRQQIQQQQFLQETAEFRELAREQIPGLRAEASAEPGTSPLFKRGLERGLTQLKSQLSGMGLGKSSALGFAAGEFAAGLTSADINRLTSLRAQLAGGATTGFGPALGAAQLGQGASSQFAQNLAQQGALAGGTFGDLGSSLITLPLLFGAGGFGKTGGAGGGGIGAQRQLGSSIGNNNLTFGSQFNQFQPPFG
jgi:hypothetical protein